MPSKLDRYTSSYLLSGYGFNDFKLKNHVASHLLDDSNDDPNVRVVAAIDGYDQGLILEASGAHGLEKDDSLVLVNQKQGAHGLVGENVRASAQGAHGVVASSIPLQHQATGDHHLGGAAARGGGG
ncbi:hypothetical protein TorRG33x02_279050 [Trema orientale]|uniref:Uncharacterized protein n=1 Tax=Trema orientale TaxID=63057 RepID=A0A2P5CNC2_TREOI|nr:hypothetical protein TorRG33x02_279050 [Trema orientale]